MKKLTLSLVLTLSALNAFQVLAAGDVAKGKAKSAICSTCHGTKGKATAPIYPNLAGQSEVYLVSALTAYKQGKRQGGMSSMMIPMAKSLSADDINNLAAFYSSLSLAEEKKPAEEKKAVPVTEKKPTVQ